MACNSIESEKFGGRLRLQGSQLRQTPTGSSTHLGQSNPHEKQRVSVERPVLTTVLMPWQCSATAIRTCRDKQHHDTSGGRRGLVPAGLLMTMLRYTEMPVCAPYLRSRWAQAGGSCEKLGRLHSVAHAPE